MGLLYQFPYINRAYILPMSVVIVNWYKYYYKHYLDTVTPDGSSQLVEAGDTASGFPQRLKEALSLIHI